MWATVKTKWLKLLHGCCVSHTCYLVQDTQLLHSWTHNPYGLKLHVAGPEVDQLKDDLMDKEVEIDFLRKEYSERFDISPSRQHLSVLQVGWHFYGVQHILAATLQPVLIIVQELCAPHKSAVEGKNARTEKYTLDKNYCAIRFTKQLLISELNAIVAT